jgi:hypothetical protein
VLYFRDNQWLRVNGASRFSAYISPEDRKREDVSWFLQLMYLAAGPQWRRVPSWERPRLWLEMAHFRVPGSSWRDLERANYWELPGDGDDFWKWQENFGCGGLEAHFYRRRGTKDHEQLTIYDHMWRVATREGGWAGGCGDAGWRKRERGTGRGILEGACAVLSAGECAARVAWSLSLGHHVIVGAESGKRKTLRFSNFDLGDLGFHDADWRHLGYREIKGYAAWHAAQEHTSEYGNLDVAVINFRPVDLRLPPEERPVCKDFTWYGHDFIVRLGTREGLAFPCEIGAWLEHESTYYRAHPEAAKELAFPKLCRICASSRGQFLLVGRFRCRAAATTRCHWRVGSCSRRRGARRCLTRRSSGRCDEARTERIRSTCSAGLPRQTRPKAES